MKSDSPFDSWQPGRSYLPRCDAPDTSLFSKPNCDEAHAGRLQYNPFADVSYCGSVVAHHCPTHRTRAGTIRRQEIIIDLREFPFVIFVLSFFVMAISSYVGFKDHQRQSQLGDDVYHDLDLVVDATLTLLSLIIGFTFSMAITRYDLRKS